MARTFRAPGLTYARQVDAPRRVSVRPAADELAVEPDRSVRHRAVDVEKEGTPRVGRWNVERLAVPADAVERQTARVAATFGGKRPLDPPVVRQIDRAPRAIVEIELDVRQVAGRTDPAGRVWRC